MKRGRRFLKCEIMDAVEAAAEHGLNLRMTPDGAIEFTAAQKRATMQPTAEDALSGWLAHESKARGRSHG